MEANIWKLYVMSACYGALFMIGVLIPFFESSGLTKEQAFQLQGIFSVAMVTFEVPSGYLSDRWGRKNTLVIGSVFGFLGMLWYPLSHEFWHFVLAEIGMAILLSFSSGTVESMVQESLATLGREKEYRKTVGQVHFYANVSQAIASILGGLIALVSLRATVWATVVPFAVGLAVSLTLKEPPRKLSNETEHAKAIWNAMAYTLFRHPALRAISLLYSLLAVLTLILMWFSQPYFEIVGLPLWAFGIVHAVITLGMGLTARFTHKAEGHISDQALLAASAALVVGSYLLLGVTTSLWSIILLFIGRSMYGIFSTAASDLTNRYVMEEYRATMHSAQKFLYRLLFASVTPAMGYATGTIGLHGALLAFGTIGGALVLLWFWGMKGATARVLS